jgi:nicotinamidase-related amidase
MSYSLLLIDMQYYFEASRGARVQKACIREIKRAIRERATIIFVEFVGYGPTLPALTDIVKEAKYKKAHTIIKSVDDGSYEITQFLTKRHLPKMNLRVCGVNTEYCVNATVRGINNKLANTNIHIVADACNSNGSHSYGLQRMQTIANTKIIRNKGWV